MSTRLLTNNFKTHVARQLIESVNEVSNSTYYVFMSNHTENADLTVPDANDTIQSTQINLYRDLIQGKRISNTNFNMIVNKNTWHSGDVYDMYEHDVELLDKEFYVSVSEGSFIHVYKCLDNNMGGQSTSQPTFAHINGANTLFYRTADGYAWKYMYSFSSADDLAFSTSKYIPIIANTVVMNAAVDGVIDVVKVEGVGRKYDNYISGSFSVGDIRVGGNSSIYGISDDAKNSNSFYTGTIIYLTTGTGAGQYRTVVDYVSNTTGKYIVLQSPFDTTPENGTAYDITPEVKITGTGRETTTARARALVNAASSNSIYRVEMLNRGAGYTYYATANVIANSAVGVQANAELKVIFPPSGGHGFWPQDELLANKLELSLKFSNTENGTILPNNGFRQIGILKDPLFANVSLSISNSVGVFSTGETIYKVSPSLIASNATVNVASNLITLALDAYNNNIQEGDKLFIDNATGFQFATVNNVVNSTTVQLTTNGFFDSDSANVYFANPTAYGICNFSNGVAVRLANVYGIFAADDLVIGVNSGAKMTVSDVQRGGLSKGFDTFIGLHKYSGSVESGVFDENEIVTTSQGASALLHSVLVSNTETAMYVSNQIGIINSGDTITGANSAASFLVATRYGPEIEFNSGEVIFIENIDRVTRSANTNETLQIIFDF